MKTNRVLGVSALVLAALAAVAGDTPAPGGPGEWTGVDLARAIHADPDAISILDVRGEDAFGEFSVPRSQPAPADPTALLEAVRAGGAGPEDLVVVAGGELADPRPGWVALRRAGFRRVHYVRDVLASWIDDIVSPVLPPDASPRAREAWEEQAELSRYFGGFPRIAAADEGGSTSDRLRRAKRRGCAF